MRKRRGSRGLSGDTVLRQEGNIVGKLLITQYCFFCIVNLASKNARRYISDRFYYKFLLYYRDNTIKITFYFLYIYIYTIFIHVVILI